MTTTSTHTNASTINIAEQKAAIEAAYKAVIAGINTELGTVQQFVILGTTFTKAELLARFQSRLDAAEKTKADRTILHASVAAEQQLNTDVAPLRKGFKQYLQSRYGQGSPELQKFGFTPAKTPQRSVAAKAAGIAKNQATRKARNTMGKKAKLKVKGTPATNTTAPTMVAAPAAPPAPPAPPKPPTAGT
jgi:hypothetical protein